MNECMYVHRYIYIHIHTDSSFVQSFLATDAGFLESVPVEGRAL